MDDEWFKINKIDEHLAVVDERLQQIVAHREEVKVWKAEADAKMRDYRSDTDALHSRHIDLAKELAIFANEFKTYHHQAIDDIVEVKTAIANLHDTHRQWVRIAFTIAIGVVALLFSFTLWAASHSETIIRIIDHLKEL